MHKNTMDANDNDDDDHKSCVRKILDDFRRSLREEFRDSLEKTESQALPVNMAAADMATADASSAEAHSQSENKQSASPASARKARQRLPGKSSKPLHAISVLHDPRIARQMRPPNGKQSLLNDQKQKMISVDDQSLNNNNKDNMEKLDDQGLNNGHKQKLTLPENQSSTETSEILRNCYIPVVKNSEENNITSETLRPLSPVGSFYIQHNMKMGSPVGKPGYRHVSHIDCTNGSPPAPVNVQTPRNTQSTATVKDINPQPCERQSNSFCANNTDSSIDKDDGRSTSSSFLSYYEDANARNENESTESSVEGMTSTDSNSVDATRQLDHHHVTIESGTVDGSIISTTEKDGIIADTPCICGRKTDAGESPCRESVDVMLTPESVDTLSGDLPLYKGNIGRLVLHSRECTKSCYIGHFCSGTEEGDTNYRNNEILLAQEHTSLEPGRPYTVQERMRDCRVKSPDSSDQKEHLTASFIQYKVQLMPAIDDRSLHQHGLDSENGDQHSGKANDVPKHMNIEHSVTPCVLVDSDSTNTDDDGEWLECQCKSSQTQNVSKEHGLESHDQVTRARSCDSDNAAQNCAQAQARAEQRKNSDVHLKFGSDGLHIKTDNATHNSAHYQQQITPPHQQLSPMPPHLTPIYDTQIDGRLTTGEAIHHFNPYPTTYTTSLPEFSTNPASSSSYGFPAVYEGGGSNNGRGMDMSQSDNRPIPYSSPDNKSNSAHYNELEQYGTSNDRRRRLGRDHSNYVLPPVSLNSFKGKSVNSDSSLVDHGPPGLPLISDDNVYGEEAGLKLVVLDKTDDEDEFLNPSPYQGGLHSQLYGSSYPSRSHSDVFPIDRRAIDRDLYKQVFDPAPEIAKTSRSGSVHTLAETPNANNTFVVKVNNKQQDYTYLNNPTSVPGMAIHVTNYDSETGPDTNRSSLGPNTLQQHQLSIGYSPNNTVPHGYLHPYYGQQYSEIVRNPQLHSGARQLYSMSQIDYDRYTSNTSQLSIVREERQGLNTDRSEVLYQAQGNSRLSDMRPISNERANLPDTKVLGPGYKFQVKKYNVAKRASILNRAEQLLDARRGHFTDRSESSDELEKIDEDDDEDFDRIDDMNGPRHRALTHLRRRVYDDSTSYNSSDDVLHNMRYQARGPVSQAARRARLTSVNARLKKQKRTRATRRRQE